MHAVMMILRIGFKTMAVKHEDHGRDPSIEYWNSTGAIITAALAETSRAHEASLNSVDQYTSA